MSAGIAIVGMACRYPDASSPSELWRNVLAQRRAFRRIPPERLNPADYLDTDHTSPDKTYIAQAAVIEGYEFDRLKFRVSSNAYQSSDLAHWLALDMAAQALADAGFEDGNGLPADRTGAIIGNTLTGEFSRANTLRLRWPYVRRTVDARLRELPLSEAERTEFLTQLERDYKRPFPEVGEETLAGGLSNTIAGRICNYFDFKGGGYTVDGACASSLLAVITACTSLNNHDLDFALAGGVDLSLDPFEIVGFAKTQALAATEMRVYDERSAGFWPGEGCGVVALMRHDDAVSQQLPIYATIRGWGVSSDGSGGITRPEFDGQILAVRRAYERAGYEPGSVMYFEGHGTGTSVGDTTELTVLSHARRASSSNETVPAAIGSIKACIGHTKAAAGVAGLIKAAMSVNTGILPPTTGCERPNSVLTGPEATLRALPSPEHWPAGEHRRSAVSAMGFGGINSHLTLEAPTGDAVHKQTTHQWKSDWPIQDAELFVLSADDPEALRERIEQISTLAARLSRSELTDVAAHLDEALTGGCTARAALVAATPEELDRGLQTLLQWLDSGETNRIDADAELFLDTSGTARSRIGFLFPGQGSPVSFDGGLAARRFGVAGDIYRDHQLPTSGDTSSTDIAQPLVAATSVAGLELLTEFGVSADTAIGHSLGELVALHWAGVFDSSTLLNICTARGNAMARLSSAGGAMASIAAPRIEVEKLIGESDVVIAGLNGPTATVVSGHTDDVKSVLGRAQRVGFTYTQIRVSYAFHSPLVAGSADAFAAFLDDVSIAPMKRSIISTVTGAELPTDTDIRELLVRQITHPVLFHPAVSDAAEHLDLLIEVGPGSVCSRLGRTITSVPAISTDIGGESIRGFLNVLAACFVMGMPVQTSRLFKDRLTKPFDLNWAPRFFTNPCELAPIDDAASTAQGECQAPNTETQAPIVAPPPRADDETPLNLVRRLVASRAELPEQTVGDSDRLLSDLHLNSITVGQLVAEAARSLGKPVPVNLTDFADATIQRVADTLSAMAAGDNDAGSLRHAIPDGVDAWYRTFETNWVPKELIEESTSTGSRGTWTVIAAHADLSAAQLQTKFDQCAHGSGVIVCLPDTCDKSSLELLLKGAIAILANTENPRFVLVEFGIGAAFAKSLHLEYPDIPTCIVGLERNTPDVAGKVLREAMATATFSYARYDQQGHRSVPVLTAISPGSESDTIILDSSDVVLVTGGGKGIASECAHSLARKTNVKLILVGRSDPAEDSDLANNLERMTQSGITYQYFSADVTDRKAIQALIETAQKRFGPITAVLHGAGINKPCAIPSLTNAACEQTWDVKVEGARNVLLALEPEQLKLLVGFGSIIAIAGLPGEADYALANEGLRHLMEQFGQDHHACRTRVIEWSVWSGIGMGERLDRIDTLRRAGVTAIPPDRGIDLFHQVIQSPSATSVAVTGRFGTPVTVALEHQRMPFLRFLEQQRVHYPGIELVCDVRLSADDDPYLRDHVIDGALVFPAVMGLEAMAQVAGALMGASTPPSFTEVYFHRPVVVPEHAGRTIRIAALVRDNSSVEVVIRSDETDFQAIHFRAICHTDDTSTNPTQPVDITVASDGTPVPLHPEDDLYGSLLFHTGRFRRLQNYNVLTARRCVASITQNGMSPWFGRLHAPHLILGDPAVRDAAIHAVQACVPHATVLPVAVDLIRCVGREHGTTLLVKAMERHRDGGTFTYDLDIADASGRVIEQWRGLRLRVVRLTKVRKRWQWSLLGPYLDRRASTLLHQDHLAVTVYRSDEDRSVRSHVACGSILPSENSVIYRSDGKPELDAGGSVSVAHCGTLTVAALSELPLGCDLEIIENREPETWTDVLGHDRNQLAHLIQDADTSDFEKAATRVWTALECMKKAGVSAHAPLQLESATEDGWIVMRAGALRIASYVAEIQGTDNPVAFAIAVLG